MDGLIALALAKKNIKGVTKSIAEEYDPTKEYAEGALAIKDGKLQKYVDGEWVETIITDNLGGGDIQQSEEEYVGEVVGGTSAPIDATLSVAGAAADAKATGDAIAALNSSIAEIKQSLYKGTKTWLEIRDLVRSNMAETLYPVGTVFTVPHEQYAQGVDLIVVAHRVVNGRPFMLLMMKDVIYGRAFDQRQAVIYAEDGLTAGAYKFTVKNQAWYTADNNKVYYFTLAHDLPAGGQGVFDMTYNATLEGKSIKTYANAYSTSVIDTAVLSATEIENAVDLGQTDGMGEYLNHMHRAVMGSNNYAQSPLRQWLNSTSRANAWRSPSTKWSRPSGYENINGFLGGFGENFAEAVAEIDVPCRTNSVYETGGYNINEAYTVKDRLWLASRDELGFGAETIACGTVFDFYDGAQDVDRIKYDISAKTTARYWWVRSPNPSYASSERVVGTSGAVYNFSANSGYGACAACAIG